MRDTLSTRRYRHLAFLNEEHELLVARAWEGYCLSGKGVLLVDGPAVARGEDRVPTLFMPRAVVDTLEQENEDVRANLLATINRYDPAHQIVVAFVEADAAFHVYRLQPQPGPEEAYLAVVGTPRWGQPGTLANFADPVRLLRGTERGSRELLRERSKGGRK